MSDRAKALFKLWAEQHVAELKQRYRDEPEFRAEFDEYLLRELGIHVEPHAPPRTLAEISGVTRRH